MTLGWYDNMAPHKTYTLTRKQNEQRAAYAARFFREVRGLGNVTIVIVRGRRQRRIARRDF